MIVPIDIDLATVEVLEQLHDNLVAVVLDFKLIHVLLAHQGSEHSPEFLTLGSKDSFVSVDLLASYLDREV
jgi:hypothetical protein